MNYIIKIIEALEDSNILLKEVTKTIKNKTKSQRGGILGMLLSAVRYYFTTLLGTSLLGNMLIRKGMLKVDYGHGKEMLKMVMETKWIFDATSSFNKF